MIHVFGQQQIKTPIFSLCKAYISKYNFLSVNFSKCVAAAHMEIGVLFSKITKTQNWSQAFLNMSLILLVNKCLKFGTTCAYINHFLWPWRKSFPVSVLLTIGICKWRPCRSFCSVTKKWTFSMKWLISRLKWNDKFLFDAVLCKTLH